jgi:hypothetical protein
MARKLNPESKGEKTKEQSRKKPAAEIAVDKTREGMEILLLMAEFSESTIGAEFLQTYELDPDNFESIFEDEGTLYGFVATLGAAPHKDMIEGAVPFFKLLAIKNPTFYQECLSDPDFESELKKRLGIAD